MGEYVSSLYSVFLAMCVKYIRNKEEWKVVVNSYGAENITYGNNVRGNTQNCILELICVI